MARAKIVCKDGHSWCSSCQIEKPVEEFYKDFRRSSGFQGYCKKCNNQKSIDRIKRKKNK